RSHQRGAELMHQFTDGTQSFIAPLDLMGTPELSEVCLAQLHEFSERPRRRVHVRTDSVSSLLSLRLPGHGHDPSGPGCARHWVTSFAGGLHGTRTRDPGASLSSVGTLPSR